MAVDPIKNSTTNPQTSWDKQNEKVHKGHHGGHKPKTGDVDDPNDPNNPQAQYLQALKAAGIDTDKYQQAVAEISTSGVKVGTPEASKIFEKYGIDVSKIPAPPANLGKKGHLHHGHHHKKKVDGDKSYDQQLKDAGIDPAAYKKACDEAEKANAAPGTDAYNEIFKKNGIDTANLPKPGNGGTQGGPSKDGRQFNFSEGDSQKFFNRFLGDEKPDAKKTGST